MKRVLLALLGAGLTSVALVPGPVRAEAAPTAPSAVSWWFEAQQVPGITLPPLAAVPDGGLLVQHLLAFESPDLAGVVPAGAVSGTLAYGAVRYDVAPRSQGTLRLDVPTGTALTAQLRACPTTGAWNTGPVPGPWFGRPPYDEACSPGVVATDGGSVTFAVGERLTQDGILDVAIVPARDATPFLVIFAPPAPDALELTAPPPGAVLPPLVPTVPDVAGGPDLGAPGLPLPDLGTPGVAAPAAPTGTVPGPLAPPATVAPAEVRSGAGAGAALGLLALGWGALTRRRVRAPRSLLGPG